MSYQEKICTKCCEWRPLTAFGRTVNGRYRSHCKMCESKRTKKDYNNTIYNRKYLYGISNEEFTALLEKQENRCAICDINLIKPVVDHSHETSAVRALLCQPCNAGLGMFKESISNLEAAIEYLKSFESQSN